MAHQREIDARRKGRHDRGASYKLTVADGAEFHWTIHPSPDRLIITVTGRGPRIRYVEAVAMLFAFDPQVTPTTIILHTGPRMDMECDPQLYLLRISSIPGSDSN